MISKDGKEGAGTKKASDMEKEIGRKISDFRVLFGISRKKLAEKIGITHQQLQKYENGINRISVGRLMAIAMALEVPIQDFFLSETAGACIEKIENHRGCEEIIRDFKLISDPNQKAAIKTLVKSLT